MRTLSRGELIDKAAHIIDAEAFRLTSEGKPPRARMELVRRRMIAQSKATRIVALATALEEDQDAQEA